MSSIDNIIPEDKWEFDESVAKCFPNMLSRSIPQYEVMRDLSAQLVTDIVNDNFKILDLGCSDGLMILALDKYLKKTNGQFIGVDVSELNGVILPSGLKNYFVIRTGKEQAFLIMPHYKKTRITVRKAATGKKEGTLKGEMEGRSLVLFCNKGDAMIDMLVRSGYGIQLVNFVPEAEELQENGQPGGMIIPERRQRFLKDVTGRIRHDGEIIKVD